MKCPLCRDDVSRPLHRAVPDFEHGAPISADFDRCSACGLVFQTQAPAPDQLRTLYPPDYGAYAGPGLLGRLKDAQAFFLVRDLRRELPGPEARVLELGAGGGHLLSELHRRGYRRLSAVDWSDAAAKRLRAVGVDFTVGDIEQPGLAGAYDCIIINNVLEHVRDPQALLVRLKTLLAAGGTVLVRTPNASAWSHQVFGRYWAGLHAPRHINVFSPESLERLARQAGYGGVRTRLAADPSAWALSLRNALASRFFGGSSAGVNWFGLIVPIFWPLASLETLRGRSSSLVASLSLDPTS